MQERKTARGPTPISEAIRSFLREQGLGSNSAYSRVFRTWNEVLDPASRQRTRPVRFRGGELLVEVSSATHLQELQNFTGDGFRREANRKLGQDTIRRVVFRLRG